MKNFLISLPITAVYAALMYYGFVLNVAGAQNIVEFLIWFEFIVMIIAISAGVYTDKTVKPLHPVHTYFNNIFSICAIIFFIWLGHGVLASIYVISKILIIGVRTQEQK